MKRQHTSTRKQRSRIFRHQNFTLGQRIGQQGRDLLRKGIDGEYGSMNRSQRAAAYKRNYALANDMPVVRNSGY